MWDLTNSAYLNNQLQVMDWPVILDILSFMLCQYNVLVPNLEYMFVRFFIHSFIRKGAREIDHHDFLPIQPQAIILLAQYKTFLSMSKRFS